MTIRVLELDIEDLNNLLEALEMVERFPNNSLTLKFNNNLEIRLVSPKKKDD